MTEYNITYLRMVFRKDLPSLHENTANYPHQELRKYQVLQLHNRVKEKRIIRGSCESFWISFSIRLGTAPIKKTKGNFRSLSIGSHERQNTEHMRSSGVPVSVNCIAT